MKNLILSFLLFVPALALAQGFYGANMVSQTFADCEGVGGTMAIHVDNNGTYGPVEVIVTFDGDTIAVTDATAFDTTIAAVPGSHTLVAFFTEAQGGPGSGQNLAVAAWVEQLIFCSAVLACAEQQLTSCCGPVMWYVDSAYVGTLDTLYLTGYIGQNVHVLGLSLYDSTVVAFDNPVLPLNVAQISLVEDDMCFGGTGQIYVSPYISWGFGADYTWNTGDTGQWLTGLSAGTYTVTVSSQNGVCSEQHTAVVGDTCNIGNGVPEAFSEAFTVFPNPASEQVTFQLDQQVQGGEVYDMTGRVVQTIPSSTWTLDVSQLAPGQYVARVRSGDKIFTARFQKE